MQTLHIADSICVMSCLQRHAILCRAECVLQACDYSVSIRATPTATRRYVLPFQQMAAVSSVVLMMVMCTSGARTARVPLLRQQAKRCAAVTFNFEWQMQNPSVEPSRIIIQRTVIVLVVHLCNYFCSCQAVRLSVRVCFVLTLAVDVKVQES